MTSLLFSLLVACGDPEPVVTAAPPAATALPPQVARAVELAQAVRAQPTDTEAALASKRATAAELDALLYEIAADPALTEAYTAAVGR